MTLNDTQIFAVDQGVTVLNADRKQPDQLKRAIAAVTETAESCCTIRHQWDTDDETSMNHREPCIGVNHEHVLRYIEMFQ